RVHRHKDRIEHEAQREIFTGHEPDVPLALVRDLDSDYLAVSRFHRSPLLAQRLQTDPRVEARYEGYTLLFETVPNRNQGFLLDWRAVPAGLELPPTPDSHAEDWPAYPRAEGHEGVEGYVDATRFASPSRCAALVFDFESTQAGKPLLELAPSGPTTLWLDDELLVSTGGEPGAVLGQGVSLQVDLEPGRHRFTALTCRDSRGRAGFYLVRR
ncbi:MAG: hypothetical protein AAF725_01795, partial [Acidobacteriota bacterium]